MLEPSQPCDGLVQVICELKLGEGFDDRQNRGPKPGYGGTLIVDSARVRWPAVPFPFSKSIIETGSDKWVVVKQIRSFWLVVR